MHTVSESIVIGSGIVLLLLANQLRRRPLRENRSYVLAAILTVGGLARVGSYVSAHGLTSVGWLSILGGVVLLGGVLGYLRAQTVRVWRASDQTAYRQGTWMTAGLWIVTLGLHLALDLKSPASAPSLLL